MIAQKHRLKKSEIEYLLKKGDEAKSQLFIIRHGENNENFSKYCVIISRKMSTKAVERNRLKRQIYEAVQLIEKDSPITGHSFVLIPKKSILNKDFLSIKKDLNGQLRKIS